MGGPPRKRKKEPCQYAGERVKNALKQVRELKQNTKLDLLGVAYWIFVCLGLVSIAAGV
jgi:hypothetical protein